MREPSGEMAKAGPLMRASFWSGGMAKVSWMDFCAEEFEDERRVKMAPRRATPKSAARPQGKRLRHAGVMACAGATAAGAEGSGAPERTSSREMRASPM